MATSKKKKAAPKAQYVGKEEFDKFQEENTLVQNKILDMLENISKPIEIVEGRPVTATDIVPGAVVNKPGAKNVSEKAADAFMSGILPPQYQKVFDKYFDTDDGFEARLMFPEVDDETGNETGGITFTIIVPKKFSNAPDGYQKMYKHDLRTRALLPHNISKGIEDWCKIVAQNLKYNKMLKTK